VSRRLLYLTVNSLKTSCKSFNRLLRSSRLQLKRSAIDSSNCSLKLIGATNYSINFVLAVDDKINNRPMSSHASIFPRANSLGTKKPLARSD
jgi:hypothetical protein